MEENNKKMAIYPIGFIGLGLGIYASSLYNSFASFPTSPNPQSGEILSFDFKGKTVFMTPQALKTYHYAEYGAVILFVICAVLYYFFLKKKEN